MSSDRETVWLSQAQIEELFDTTQSNVSMHISNVLSESELDDSVYKDFLYMVGNGRNYQTAIFNLDMILAVGYRVKSNMGLYISIITRSSMTASSWLITKNVILSEHL